MKDHTINESVCENRPRHQAVESNEASVASHSGEIKFDIMAAMCHGNRGIGNKMKLPWPRLE